MPRVFIGVCMQHKRGFDDSCGHDEVDFKALLQPGDRGPWVLPAISRINGLLDGYNLEKILVC